MISWSLGYVALVVWAVAQNILHCLQAWEHRRFVRSRVLCKRLHRAKGRVALLAPCKGVDTQMAANLRALFEQDYGNYEILFVVESREDPAADVISNLIEQNPLVSARLIVAGPAVWSGQKVHNLIFATRQLSEDIEYLAFVDSDARPRRQWLSLLMDELVQSDVGATTGYRWFVPRRPTLTNYLLYSIDSPTATFVGPSRHHLVWGGSWAIRRDTFEQLGLRSAWRGTLSDDLVAAQILARTGKRVLFEPSCVLTSPIDMSFRTMFGFVRRQYSLGRIYAPRLWLMSLALSTVSHLALWVSVLLCCLPLAGAVRFSPLSLCAASVLYGLYALRAWLRQDASRCFLPAWQAKLRYARLFDICLCPISALVSWAGLISSAVGNRIVWRGISYELSSSGQVLSIKRQAAVAHQPRLAVSHIAEPECIHAG